MKFLKRSSSILKNGALFAAKAVLFTFVASIIAACGGGGSDSNTPAVDPVLVAGNVGTGLLQPTALVVGSEQLQSWTLVGNKLTVPKPSSATYSAGSVLILDGLGGRMLYVVSMSETSLAHEYLVRDASLTEGFKELNVQMQGSIGPSDLGAAFVTNDSEIEIAWVTPSIKAKAGEFRAQASAETDVLGIKFKNFGGSVGSGIQLDGETTFQMNPSLDIDLAKKPGATLPALTFAASIKPNLGATLTTTSKYGGKLALTKEFKHKFQPIRRVVLVPLGPIVVPVPVWVQPALVLSASAEGSAASAFSTTKGFSTSGALGFSRDINGLVTTNNTFATQGIMSVSGLQAELAFAAIVPKFELQFFLYSVAGPTFDVGTKFDLKGTFFIEPTSRAEGITVAGAITAEVNGGLKAETPEKVAEFFGGVSVDYSPIQIKIFEYVFYQYSKFFPFSGSGSIVVTDNGNVKDDIFEVSVDGVALGRTSKGGSGQFRIQDLRPGQRQLKIKTVEDDAPPGTYSIQLGNGLTFADGGSTKAGLLNLNSEIVFSIVVPATP